MNFVPHNKRLAELAEDDSSLAILFVDDEPNLLAGIRRALRKHKNTWNMTFAEGGDAAIQALNTAEFDVIVCDLNMPGVDGFQVLQQCQQQHPETIRIILSGNADLSSVVKTVGPSHQFLSKPCDADQLTEAIHRAISLRTLLAHPALKKIVSGMDSLPCLPNVFNDLQEALRSDNVAIDRIADIIIQDVSLTGRVLKLVNSAFFGLKRPIYEPRDAVSYLGVETIKSLSIASHTFEDLGVDDGDIQGLWQHSLRVGQSVRVFAEQAQLTEPEIEGAYLAGIMHDTGKLILAKAMAGSSTPYSVFDTPYDQEVEHFGANHGQVGAYLMGLWGCSDFIIEGIARHHNPEDWTSSERFNLPLAVHFANAMDYKISQGHSLNQHLNTRFIVDNNLLPTLSDWKSIAETLHGETDASSE